MPASPSTAAQGSSAAAAALRYNHLAAMRHAIDTHHKRSRPTVAEVVEKIGPMRNKAAAEQGTEVRRERKGRRG